MAFSADQTSVELYEYQGPAAAESLLRGLLGDEVGLEEQGSSVRSQIFHTLFKLRHSINVTQNGEQLNRECSLFSLDSCFMVVGSAAFVAEESQLHYFDVYRNNESVSLSPRVPLEDYTLYLIDIENGRLCDKRTFKVDKIFLSHNQGLYLHKNTLAVLSVQHQLIHLFLIERDPLLGDGRFVDVRSIGRFCYEDDEFILCGSRPAREGGRSRSVRPFRETAINCLKHRFLTFMFRRAMADDDECKTKLRKFYQNFDQLCALRMWKMQLLDDNHLLIKYAHEEVSPQVAGCR